MTKQFYKEVSSCKDDALLFAYLVFVVLVDVVDVGPFPLVTLAEDDAFLFLFLCVVLSTVSLCGNTIPDAGAATIMLVSVAQLAVFFSLFLGGPLQWAI